MIILSALGALVQPCWKPQLGQGVVMHMQKETEPQLPNKSGVFQFKKP